MTFHLMIVDDEPTIRKGLSNFIKWDTLDSIVDATACDGAEAMELIRLKQPDIVITDIRMPQVDGIALAKFIYEEYPQIKVILLTGYADFQYAQSAICYAVSDFLLKPTSKDKLFYPQLGVKLCSMAGGGVQKIYMVFLREPSRRDRSGSDLFHLRDGFEIKMNFDRNVSCFIFVNALMHDDFFD